jgi:hypothetical protein
MLSAIVEQVLRERLSENKDADQVISGERTEDGMKFDSTLVIAIRLLPRSIGMGVLVCGIALLSAPALRAQEKGIDSSEIWGSRGIFLQMNASGATIEFDCAHGTVTDPMPPIAGGAFSVAGTYTPEMGGPVQKDNPSRDLPATYKISISGDTMRLEVILADRSRQPPPFTLTRGTAGKVIKCR